MPLVAGDLFCGAGGMSTGLVRALRSAGRELDDLDLVAVNHWKAAVRTHQLNHPFARHFCARVESLDPMKVFPGHRVDLLVAGVECTHHSQARGGKPVNDQSRASAWNVLDWAGKLKARDIVLENVPEFRNWGPLDDNNRPIKSRRGEIFESFIGALEAYGYRVEWKLLTCADFGDPTTRRRLFLRARIDNGDISWPDPTHAKGGGDLAEWVAARQIIDWSNPGTSIFGRKRPLAPRTIERIAEGIRRYCGDLAAPFLVMLYSTGGSYIALAQPFLDRLRRTPLGLGVPLPTLTTEHVQTKIEPFILPHDQFSAKNGTMVDSIHRPMRTITAHNGSCNYVVSPFLVPHFGERPGQRPRVHSLDEPTPTVTASKGAGSLCMPFVVRYNGNGGTRPVDEPLGTVTTRDRFALVTADGTHHLDILFRMLEPRELARAQGFPDGYQFIGTKRDAVRQIGNAVPVNVSEHLCRSALLN